MGATSAGFLPPRPVGSAQGALARGELGDVKDLVRPRETIEVARLDIGLQRLQPPISHLGVGSVFLFLSLGLNLRSVDCIVIGFDRVGIG